jgi:galactokinase
MYRVVKGHTSNIPDAEDFIDILNQLDQHSDPKVRRLFEPQPELVVTRAPGRLDVMGGIADYSGSMVLELPIREATFVALQRDPELRLRIASLSADSTADAAFEMPLTDFLSAGEPVDYEVARAYFQGDPQQHWAAYVAGVFLVLMRERDIRFSQGARILISSSVSEGKGVSSSAALEVAVMQAVAAAFGVELQPRDVALLCQKVENLVVGAPCGIMDQMTSVCGEANRLLALLCQPAELREMIAIPEDMAFWGLDSGIRHSVAGADYGSVRAGAFMGYRIIADLARLKINEVASEDRWEVDDPRWGGYLANISPSEFEESYVHHLPERLSGADFLARYKGTTDPITRINPEREYAVRVPTGHPIYENHRVRRFAELLSRGVPPWVPLDAKPHGAPEETPLEKQSASEQRLEKLGELMYQSHESYSACGLNSEGTDLLVNLVREAGPGAGLYGAKITGGGSGGTVAVLGTRTAGPGIATVREKYARETNHRPYIFAGSSPGSASFGHLILEAID